MRRAFFTGGTLVLATAALIVPLPVLTMKPGPVLATGEAVSIPGRPDEINGRLLATTVRLSEASTVAAVTAAVDRHARLLRRQAVIPRGADPDEFLRLQHQLFEESAVAAKVVGLRQAGFPVQLTGGGARVAAVIEGSPAEGHIRKGDLITAVDGRPVAVAADLVAATARTQPGEQVRLTVVRGGHTTTVDVPAEPVTIGDRPALGVLVRSEEFDVQLPFAVSVADGWVGGPSAGLMLALAIYDLASTEDLTAGRVIAGTGTIDATGRVGPVDGVAAKVEAARRAGASLFLVPASQAGAAVNVGGENLTVVPVAHIEEALAALRHREVGEDRAVRRISTRSGSCSATRRRGSASSAHRGSSTSGRLGSTSRPGGGTGRPGGGTAHPGSGTGHPGSGTGHPGSGTDHPGSGRGRAGSPRIRSKADRPLTRPRG